MSAKMKKHLLTTWKTNKLAYWVTISFKKLQLSHWKLRSRSISTDSSCYETEVKKGCKAIVGICVGERGALDVIESELQADEEGQDTRVTKSDEACLATGYVGETCWVVDFGVLAGVTKEHL